jgi:hypothetical protein
MRSGDGRDITLIIQIYVIVVVGLILALGLNVMASSTHHCNGPCGCLRAEPPSKPGLLWSCPNQSDTMLFIPVVCLIEAFPLLTALLFAGSLMIAVLGRYMERRAQRVFQRQPGPGQATGSQRQVVFLAIAGPVLELLPLIVVTVAGFVAPFIPYPA